MTTKWKKLKKSKEKSKLSGCWRRFYVEENGPTVNARDLRQKADGRPNEH